MKRFALLALCLAALAASCVSAPAAGTSAGSPASSGNRGDVPPWIDEFPPEDVLWGIGAAKQSTESLSMTAADGLARQSISQQLETVARGMLTNYARDAGVGGSQSSIQLVEAVSRQLTSTQLRGAAPIRRWKAADGTWWFLLQYPKSEAAKATADIVDTEAARYAEFKALDALKMMDAELAALKEKPVVTTE